MVKPAEEGATLTREDHRAWQEDGVVCLRQVFDADWIATLKAGFEQSLATPGPLAKDYAEGKGRFFTDHAMYRRIAVFRDFVFKSPVTGIAAALMGSSKLNLVDDHLLVKEPGTDNPTYWHHDYPYFQFDGEQFCSFWIPLDPANAENGAMRFAVGSHRWGKLYHPVRIGKGDAIPEAEDLDGLVPDIDADPKKYPVISWDLAPGDAVVFHGKTLHAANPNASQSMRRRALAIRLTGDDITWRPRPYAPVDEAHVALEQGGPIDCDHYPVIWRNEAA